MTKNKAQRRKEETGGEGRGESAPAPAELAVPLSNGIDHSFCIPNIRHLHTQDIRDATHSSQQIFKKTRQASKTLKQLPSKATAKVVPRE